MIAFNYVDHFDELADLPQLKKLEVLEIAHGRVLRSWKNLSNVALCFAVGLLVGVVPRTFVQMSGGMQGLLLGIGILVAVQYFRRLYAQLLHEKVKELV